jgi:hypothetical protein
MIVACCPGPTLHGIVKQSQGSVIKVKSGVKVITIEPAQNPLTIEWAVRLFSTAGSLFEIAFLIRSLGY